MGCISKGFSFLFVVILAVSSVIIVESVFAQSIPKPTVPEFSVKYFDRSYDIPTTYGVDTYTGKTVVTKEGYHVQNKTIIVTIQNQPFNRYTDSNGSTIGLYYKIGSKGHFGSDWGTYSIFYQHNLDSSVGIYYQSSYDSTDLVAVFGLQGNNGSEYFGQTLPQIADGGEIDFRVQAYTAYFITVQDTPNPFNIRHPYHDEQIITGSSDWSNVQTIRVPEGSVTTSTPQTPTLTETTTPTTTTPTLTPTAPDTNSNSITLPLNTFIIIIAVFAVALVTLSVLLLRKHRKPISQDKPNV